MSPSFFQAPGVINSRAPEIIVRTSRKSSPHNATSPFALANDRRGSRGKSPLREFQSRWTAQEQARKQTRKKEIACTRILARSVSAIDGMPAWALLSKARDRKEAITKTLRSGIITLGARE